MRICVHQTKTFGKMDGGRSDTCVSSRRISSCKAARQLVDTVASGPRILLRHHPPPRKPERRAPRPVTPHARNTTVLSNMASFAEAPAGDAAKGASRAPSALAPISSCDVLCPPPRARIRRQRCVGPLTATPSRFSDAGAKIFKTKCAQCHVAESGGGHKQVRARASPCRPRSPIRRGDPSPRVRPASLPVSLSRRGGDDVGGAVPSGITPRETSTPRPDDDSNRRRALTPRLPLPPRSTRRAPTSAASSVASPAPPRASRTPRPTRTRA